MTSILQILQCAVCINSKILKIYGTVKDSPAKLQEGLKQLHRLTVTAKSISASEVLRSEEIQIHVAEILEKVKKLHSVVDKMASKNPKSLKRYLQVATGNSAEKRVFESFANLENDKSTMAINLIVNQINLTSSVKDGVAKIVDELPTIQAIYRSIEATGNTLMGTFEKSVPEVDIMRTANRADTFSTLLGSKSDESGSLHCGSQDDVSKHTFIKSLIMFVWVLTMIRKGHF